MSVDHPPTCVLIQTGKQTNWERPQEDIRTFWTTRQEDSATGLFKASVFRGMFCCSQDPTFTFLTEQAADVFDPINVKPIEGRSIRKLLRPGPFTVSLLHSSLNTSKPLTFLLSLIAGWRHYQHRRDGVPQCK